MNKKFLEQYMKTEPTTTDKKYLFLVDSQDVAFAIISSGYCAVWLSSESEYYYDLESFLEYMDKIAMAGTYQMDYCYVPACLRKKSNDALEQYFKENHLNFHPGWMLFKDKEYLIKFENQEELKTTLAAFILRFERNPREQPDIDKFHRYNEKGKRIGVFDMEIVDHLIQTVPFFMVGSTPYIYNHGVYEEDIHGNRLKYQIQKLLYRDCIKSNTIQAIYNLLISQPQVHRKFSDLNNQPSHWVNFLNGYYDVLTNKMIEHDAKYLSINQIAFNYYPERKQDILGGGETIKKYLSISLPDKEEQMTFWQYMGYCMTTDTRFQKFLTFKGQDGTGKSIAVSLIQYIVGQNNCSCVSLQDLNKRFYPTALYGKLLNACADIPSIRMESDDIIKKATGEDSMLYEKKGQDPMQFFSYAKLLFSANKIPKYSGDKSNALYRRMLILEMNHIIPENQKDRSLKEKLFREADYAIHMAMIALRKLFEDEHFTESNHSLMCVEKLRQSSDSVQAFLAEKTQRKDKASIMRSRVYEAYVQFCEDYGREPLNKANFFEDMEDKGVYTKKTNKGIVYRDIDWAEEDFVLVESEDEIPFEQMSLVTK